MLSPDPHHDDDLGPKVAGTLDAIRTLAESADLSIEDALEALRTGKVEPGRTFGQALDRAWTQVSPGTREALDPYARVVRHGMPGTCGCTCAECLDVVERHRAVEGRPGEREPVPCPCQEAGSCACASRDHLVGASCLDACPVLADVVVASEDGQVDVARNWVRARAQRRQLARNARRAKKGLTQRRSGGEHAVEQFNDVLRHLYRHAGLRLETRVGLTEALPTIRRPSREEGRGLTAAQFAEVIQVAWTGGDDPDLDGLMVLYEVGTGARRQGMLYLTTDGLDVESMKVRLWEKAGSEWWQPCAVQLMGMLIEHVIDRHLVLVDPTWANVTADDVLAGRRRLPSGIPVFHYRPIKGSTPHPLTRRRLNTFYDRLQETLPWADQQQVHGHDLRRTGSSWIERRFGRGVAKAWLRHADDVTGSYTRGTAEEVRAATDWLAAVLFGDQD